MKRSILPLALAFLLAGCFDDPVPKITTGASSDSPLGEIRKWRDPETGCVYLYRNYGAVSGGGAYVYGTPYGGLTIRFREDGKPDCMQEYR